MPINNINNGDSGSVVRGILNAVINFINAITKSDVGLGNVDNTSDMDKPVSTATQTTLNLKADLVGGTVPSAQLPSYVDDILEYANLASFPVSGETGKIYIAIDTGKQYRWSGSAYVAVSNGFISSTADVPDSLNKRYVTDANLVLIGAISSKIDSSADEYETAQIVSALFLSTNI